MAPIKTEMDDPSSNIRPNKGLSPPKKKIPSGVEVELSQKEKEKCAVRKDNEEIPSNVKQPRVEEPTNVSTVANAVSERRIGITPPLNRPESLALCSVSPHKNRRPVVLRRVTREEVVQPLPVAVPTPPTPPAIDIKAIVTAFIQHLSENQQHLRLLQPSAQKRKVKQEPPEVITLDDDTPAVEEARQSADAELATLMATLDEGQKKRLTEYLLKSESEGNKPATVFPAEPVAGTLQQLPQNEMNSADESESSGRSAEDEMHVRFWNGKTESKTCPICKRTVGISKKAKTEHYLKYHYDVYFSLIVHGRHKSTVEGWVGARLGTGSRREKREKHRVCLHCKTENSYAGRVGLIKHLTKVHPALLAQMKKEYAVVSRKQLIEDKEVHRRMVHVSSRLSGSHR